MATDTPCRQSALRPIAKSGRTLRLLADDHESYGGIVEWMNEAMLTKDRLRIYRDGLKNDEYHLVHRGKLLAEKIHRLGLVDVASTRQERDWFRGDVLNLIEDTPDGGEIFIVGRSLTTAGDYVIFAPGVEHRWTSLDASIVVTVRWPSAPALEVAS